MKLQSKISAKKFQKNILANTLYSVYALPALIFRNMDEIYNVWHIRVLTDCELPLISNDLLI